MQTKLNNVGIHLMKNKFDQLNPESLCRGIAKLNLLLHKKALPLNNELTLEMKDLKVIYRW